MFTSSGMILNSDNGDRRDHFPSSTAQKGNGELHSDPQFEINKKSVLLSSASRIAYHASLSITKAMDSGSSEDRMSCPITFC